ncbi:MULTISPECIES: pyridoxal 5'-phosphate synthase glutaminase subunit PdxT [unclassified Methanoregula]|uniref:pyridoxal 5'-phosphate synthase glutaminase subunit PdxT n=1 Tax=unclassified Methanoregula TaxID=2649730 RepID=UPI0009C73A85|nr:MULTISPECIES: pyridoxal 5'-phosphate synthase glutaminase subunit PdxT [unclassified Methanoregula]OPX64316.1 MAG: Glutamine amidotransferase subunit PdxT [Methanoregula sp. PtaB.Bin085]OPY33559.1 MAG: Glutamine amidotransferase subunit PdxT [Methanoregula sp. PtaU1.Bin006]
MDARIGVLALQGNVSEHIDAFLLALERMGHGSSSEVFEVRSPADLAECSVLAIPGGESTTISRLIDKNSLYDPIRVFKGGIFATCAGMVLMATRVDDPRVRPLGLIEMTVDRNAFGRQRESFEADLPVAGLVGKPFHAVFIRAPVVSRTGKSVKVLARINKGIVAVEYGRHVAFSFHPELGNDTRLHELFLHKNGY